MMIIIRTIINSISNNNNNNNNNLNKKHNDNVGNIGIDVSACIHVIIKIQSKLYKFCLKYTLPNILVGLNQNCLSCVIITFLFGILCSYNIGHSFYTQIIYFK